jgi:hypothetical protein
VVTAKTTKHRVEMNMSSVVTVLSRPRNRSRRMPTMMEPMHPDTVIQHPRSPANHPSSLWLPVAGGGGGDGVWVCVRESIQVRVLYTSVHVKGGGGEGGMVEIRTCAEACNITDITNISSIVRAVTRHNSSMKHLK